MDQAGLSHRSNVAPMGAVAYRRSRIVRLSSACLLVALCACDPPSFAHSTFESGDDAWRLTGDANTQPDLLTSGGNPGGHICGTDQVGGSIWYFVAPQKFLGDASSIYGKRLTFDLKQDSIFNQIRGRDVVLNGGGLSIVYNMRSPPGTDWTPYSIALEEAGADGAPAAGAAQSIARRVALTM